MKILFVIDSLGASGAEHSTAMLLPQLRDHGHQVAAATLYDAGFGDEDRIRADGFDVRPLVAKDFIGRVRELRRRIKHDKPDIVHTALFSSDIVGRVAAWRAGAIVVSSLVSTPYAPERLTDPAVRRWKLRLVQLLDAVTARLMTHRLHAVSEGVADVNSKALRYPRERISVVERGRSRDTFQVSSTDRRERARAALGLAADANVVLSVGRQEHLKAHVDLVRAVDVLVPRVPNLVVLLAGREGNASGDLRAALREYPRAAGVIRLLGHRHDIPDLLCAADVLAISSTYEGTAGAAIEAMAVGCPVVCTAMPGIRGILRDEDTALLVPVGVPAALADAVQRILVDPELAQRLRFNGPQEFEKRFTVEASAANMESFYTRMMNARRASGK